MSRDATGVYSAWAEEKIACPVCGVAAGAPCKIQGADNDEHYEGDEYVENGVHRKRTEAAPPWPPTEVYREREPSCVECGAAVDSVGFCIDFLEHDTGWRPCRNCDGRGVVDERDDNDLETYCQWCWECDGFGLRRSARATCRKTEATNDH